MSTVVNRTTLGPIFNVSLTKYGIANFWHDPDLSAVINIIPIYWKEVGGVFSEMSEAEKAIKDAEIGVAKLAQDRLVARGDIDNSRILRAFAKVVMDEINILRAEHALSARTLSQLITAIKNKIDTN